MTDIAEWYRTIPRFTKFWLTATFGISILARFGILPPHILILSNLLYKKLHIWRAATGLFFYPLMPQTGFHFLINCFYLYSYSVRLETEQFKNKPADYLFLLLFSWICCVISGLVFDLMILMDPMVLCVLYVWCKFNEEVIVNFWFGTRFKAMYLPWILLGVNLLMTGGGFDSLLGILIGHLYYFFKFQYPQDFGGSSLLETPNFLKSFYPDESGGVHGFGIPPASGRQANASSNRFSNVWGRGSTLGRQ